MNTQYEERIISNAARKQWSNTGKFYRNYREKNNFTKDFVAKSLGIASSTLSKFENGEPCLRAKTIECGYKLLISNVDMSRSLQAISKMLDCKVQ